MSWQAQTAVNHHSKLNDMKLFRFLMYLAEGADEDGLVDPAPSRETMTEFFDCTKRTIRNWLTRLYASGELELVRTGSGPGNPSAYRITLSMVENGGNKGGKTETKAETIPDFLSTFEAFKAEVKAEISELKAEISELKAEKAETEGGKGGNGRRKAHSTESGDDPYLDPSLIQNDQEGGTPQPPYPAEPEPYTAEEIALWQTAVELVNRWARYRGTYRQLDPHVPADMNDYFRPVLGLVVECEGDGELAWSLLESQCRRMMADNLTVIRAGPVVAQIRNEQQRAELPPGMKSNGRTSSAEDVLRNYAQLRQEFLDQ